MCQYGFEICSATQTFPVSKAPGLSAISLNWTINVWNKLSPECVHASSVNMFKNRIDKYLVKAGYT